MYAQVAPSEEDAIELQTLSRKTPAAADGSSEDERDGILSLSIADNGNASDHHRKQLQLYRLCNVAVPLNYFLVGLVQGLAYPLLNVYPLDLGASEAQQTTLLTLKTLPSCFKILFGIMSDNLPLYGLRRKPYLYIGWFLSSLSLVPLLLFSDLSLVTNDNFEQDYNHNYAMNTTTNTTHDRITPSDAPSMPFLSACFFLWANGVWMADVMGDALVAERAKYESTRDRGNTQAICYILRGFGFVLVAPLSSMVYSNSEKGPFYIILITCLLPLLHVPALVALQEQAPQLLLSARDQLGALYKTACSPAVWRPMGYIFLALSCFVTNSAWKQFLETCLHFQPNQLNALMIVAGVMAFGGVVLYKLLLYRMSWRTLYVLTISVNAVVSGMQLLLIYGTTLGLPPFVFALGDESMKDFVLGVQYLPMVTMMVHLVPTGIEGAAYALFTTTFNVAQSLADSVSTMLLGIWDVSKPTLENGDWSGLTRLTILTTVLQTLPILAVGLLPHSVEDLQRIQDDDDDKSQSGKKKYGGVTYLSLVSFALVWTIFVNVMNIVRPGWMGES